MDKDAIILLLCLIGMYIVGFFGGYTAFNKYDVNEDKVVNSKDLLELRKYLLEMES